MERPSVGVPGSRHLHLPLLIETLKLERAGLSEIGLAPYALLVHALDHPTQSRRHLPFTPVRKWLEVSTIRLAFATVPRSRITCAAYFHPLILECNASTAGRRQVVNRVVHRK